jgi:crotonobetainyl-CoA:carnitine CoA-transferase CaiB-like acyl-CoA transferase
MLRTSGFGQVGPYRNRRAFNTTAESFGGMRYLIGDPGKPPARPGVALGDYAGALFGAIGVLVALYHRDATTNGHGQEIDNALYEGVMRLIEYTIPAYAHTGRVRERVGPGSAGTVPARSYLSQDGQWIAISAASDKTFRCLCGVLGNEELADDPRYATNADRIVNVDSLNAEIERWMSETSATDALARLDHADVPAVPVYSAADLVADEHVAARGSLVTVDDAELGETLMQGVTPRLGRTPGKVVHAGPSLGQHNREVYEGLLGMSTDEVDQLVEDGVI